MGTAKSPKIEPLSYHIVPQFIKFVEREGNYFFPNHSEITLNFNSWQTDLGLHIHVATKQRKYDWFNYCSCTYVPLTTLGTMYVLFVMYYFVLCYSFRSTEASYIFVDIKLSWFIETLNFWMLRVLKTLGQLSSQNFEIEEIAIFLTIGFLGHFNKIYWYLDVFAFLDETPIYYDLVNKNLLCK